MCNFTNVQTNKEINIARTAVIKILLPGNIFVPKLTSGNDGNNLQLLVQNGLFSIS